MQVEEDTTPRRGLGGWPIATLAALVLVINLVLVGDRSEPGVDETSATTTDDVVRVPDGAGEATDAERGTDLSATAVDELLVPDRGALLGAFVGPEGGWARADQEATWTQREVDIGRGYDVAHAFYPWDREFPSWRESWHRDAGRIPLLSWAPGHPSAEVAAGRHDAVIRQRARGVAAFGTPVFMRWFWEMDGRHHGDLAGRPAEYVDAWRRVVRLFEEEGADNAVWVWCPTAEAFDDGRADQWYPGDDVVDWTCADGYNWAPGLPYARWRELGEVFASFHAWGTEVGKPMMVGEFGTAEGTADRAAKADWYAAAAASAAGELSGIRAWILFDTDKRFDWRVTSSPEALAAFRRFADAPWFADVRGTRDDDA